jgi:hypothetical protein
MPEANTITPASFQVPPRPAGASQTTAGGSPSMEIRFSLPDEKNPT